MNAVWHRYFPNGVLINAIGMLVATLASIGTGALLYRFVESRSKVFGRNGLTLLLALMVGAALLIESLDW